MPKNKLTPRELATILAALRYWQREGLRGDPQAELDIASDSGAFEMMTPDEIDPLCERLNWRLRRATVRARLQFERGFGEFEGEV